MNTITTATGKKFDVDKVATLPNPPYVYIRVLNDDPANIKKVFSDEDETKEMTYGNVLLKGYTKFGYIIEEGSGWKVRLSK